MENNTLSCFLLGIFSEEIVLLMICQSWTRTMRNFYCQIFNTKCFLTKFYHRALIVFSHGGSLLWYFRWSATLPSNISTQKYLWPNYKFVRVLCLRGRLDFQFVLPMASFSEKFTFVCLNYNFGISKLQTLVWNCPYEKWNWCQKSKRK